MRSLILPFVFLAMPLAEIATFVLVGREVGVWTTLFLVLASGLVGAILLRVQGLGVVNRIRDAGARGVDPGRELVHGVMIVIAAFLLIIPGFLSDLLGILLFIPAIREAAWRLLKNRITIVTNQGAGFGAGRGAGFSAGGATRQSPFNRGEQTVIDLSEDEFSHDAPRRPPIDDPDKLR